MQAAYKQWLIEVQAERIQLLDGKVNRRQLYSSKNALHFMIVVSLYNDELDLIDLNVYLRMLLKSSNFERKKASFNFYQLMSEKVLLSSMQSLYLFFVFSRPFEQAVSHSFTAKLSCIYDTQIVYLYIVCIYHLKHGNKLCLLDTPQKKVLRTDVQRTFAGYNKYTVNSMSLHSC